MTGEDMREELRGKWAYYILINTQSRGPRAAHCDMNLLNYKLQNRGIITINYKKKRIQKKEPSQVSA